MLCNHCSPTAPTVQPLMELMAEVVVKEVVPPLTRRLIPSRWLGQCSFFALFYLSFF